MGMKNKVEIQQGSNDIYKNAVRTIKKAILKSQYQAAKHVNREMLSLYYGIGHYISENSREGFWGTGAIKSISEQLRKELPGLRGFSATSLKKMREFYEEWNHVISKSTARTDKLIEEKEKTLSSIDTVELIKTIPTATAVELDIDQFLRLSFSHHIEILNGEKDISKRIKYIGLTLSNNWSAKYLRKQIKEKAADSYGNLPSNFNRTLAGEGEALKALNMFKDSYLLDFINTEDKRILIEARQIS